MYINIEMKATVQKSTDTEVGWSRAGIGVGLRMVMKNIIPFNPV